MDDIEKVIADLQQEVSIHGKDIERLKDDSVENKQAIKELTTYSNNQSILNANIDNKLNNILDAVKEIKDAYKESKQEQKETRELLSARDKELEARFLSLENKGKFDVMQFIVSKVIPTLVIAGAGIWVVTQVIGKQ